MTTSPTKDRSHESIINDTLARLLRERSGLSTAAETLHAGKRPDIIVRLAEGPVVLETEFEPAATVSRLDERLVRGIGMSVDGQRVQNVFAITVPAQAPLDQPTTSLPTLGDLYAGAGRNGGSTAHPAPGSPAPSGRARQRGCSDQTPPAGNLEEATDFEEGLVKMGNGSRLVFIPRHGGQSLPGSLSTRARR